MKQSEAMKIIKQQLKGACLQDLADQTGVHYSTLWKWRTTPPYTPSLKVFVRLAIFYGLPIGIWELEDLT